jgi:hypothetical protein
VLVDILLQAVTLLLFTLVGIGVLATVVADRALIGSLVSGAAILGLGLAGAAIRRRESVRPRVDGAGGKTRLVVARQSGKPA